MEQRISDPRVKTNRSKCSQSIIILTLFYFILQHLLIFIPIHTSNNVIYFIILILIYLPKKTISQVKNIVCNPFGFGAVTQMTIKMMLSDEIDLLISVNFNFSFLKYSTNLVAFITVNYT